MLKREYEILKAFDDVEKMPAGQLHIIFRGKHDLSTITSLTERGLLANDGGSVHLTQEGYKVFQEEVERNAKAAEEKKLQEDQKRKDRRQSFIHDLIVAAFSVLLTLAIEHHRSVIEFVNELLEVIATFFH